MSEQLSAVVRRIESVRQLEAVVAAMRGIASSRAKQGREKLAGIRAFASVAAEAIGQALPLLEDMDRAAKPSSNLALLIVFCAEQGFVGAFTDHMLDAATSAAAEADLFLVGTRGAMLAEQRRIASVWRTAMAAHIDGVSLVATRIAEALYQHICKGGVNRVDLVFPSWSGAGGLAVERRRLLPFDYHRFAVRRATSPPLTTLPAGTLLTRLSEEYVFAEICEAAMLAFVAENEARLAAMGTAKGNIERVHADLESIERQVRQAEITAEVVEQCAAIRM